MAAVKPGTYNLDLYKGDSYQWRFRLWADPMFSVPIDLTGATVKSEIRDKSGGSTIVALECVIEEPNTVFATLSPADSALCPAAGVWDLQITYPAGTVSTALAGSVAVTPDVTDSSEVEAVGVGWRRAS